MMEIGTAQLMDLIARLNAGAKLDVILAEVPAEQREEFARLIKVAVINPDGQLDHVQPIDYTMIP